MRKGRIKEKDEGNRLTIEIEKKQISDYTYKRRKKWTKKNPFELTYYGAVVRDNNAPFHLERKIQVTQKRSSKMHSPSRFSERWESNTSTRKKRRSHRKKNIHPNKSIISHRSFSRRKRTFNCLLLANRNDVILFHQTYLKLSAQNLIIKTEGDQHVSAIMIHW